MWSIRRHRYSILTLLLLILTIWYVSTASESTRNSPFYIKTVDEIERRRNEGPQAVGAAPRTFLKGGSVRPEEGKLRSGTWTTEDASHAAEAVKGMIPESDSSDRDHKSGGVELHTSRSLEEIELEKQILKARTREQGRLKEELRNQLKYRERERQRFLAHGKVVNPNWVGAFEKERRPAAVAGGVNEVAPDSDPFRNKPANAPMVPVIPVGELQNTETRPDLDPFRDAPMMAPGEGTEGVASRQKKVEHQQQKLAQEQEYLHPEPVADIKPHLALDTEPVEHVAAQLAKGDVKNAIAEMDPVPKKPLRIGNKAATEDTTQVEKEDVNTHDSTSAHKTPAELELSRISALSPVLIFSKTYCPYSKKAKRILLEAFDITPTPYVVELDTHELGAELQAQLKEMTGRGTVPNILVSGKSVGGGDDMERLWESGKLADTIKEFGGKRILAVKEAKGIL